MKCKFCGKEIEEGSLFCGYCGKEQPKGKICVNCGCELEADAELCGYCGAKQIDKIISLASIETKSEASNVKNNIIDSSEQTQTIAKQSKVESVPQNTTPIIDEADTNETECKKSRVKYVIIAFVVIVSLIVAGSFINSSLNNSNYPITETEEHDTIASIQDTDTLENSLNEDNTIDEGFDFTSCITQAMLTDNGIYKFNFNINMEECAKIANSHVLDAHAEPCGYRYIDKFNEVGVQIDIDGNIEDPQASVDGISISFDLSNHSSSETENAFSILCNYIKKNLDVKKCLNNDKSSIRFETTNKSIEINVYNNIISLHMETLYAPER